MRLKERYRIVQLIGQGGFGKTFLAVDEGESPPKPCVIKQLSPQNLSAQGITKATELFQQEALRLAELGKHPQIPTLLTHFEQDSCFYLVQEFIDGSNLQQLVEAEGNFSEAQIWQLLNELLPLLEYIHNHQIIHRDIKPENIIRRTSAESGNQLVLVDFGAAKRVSGMHQIQTGTRIGSPEYIAPEQVRGKAVFASDLYSLGVTCIFLLTGIPPFDLFDVVNDCWAWRQYLTTGVSDSLSQILDKLLQNALSRRFLSADAVLQAVLALSNIPNLKSNNQAVIAPSNLSNTQNLKSKIEKIKWECVTSLTENSGLLANINSVAFSPNGEALASASDDKAIRLWNLDNQKVIYTLSGHSHCVKSVAFSPDGKTLASASDDHTIKLWNVTTGQEICSLTGHTHAVKSVAFSPQRMNGHDYLASVSWDKTIKIWDISTGQEICTLTGHGLQVNAVAFSPDGQFLATASFDRTVRVWDLGSYLQVDQSLQKTPLCSAVHQTLIGHSWPVFTVAFSPDGSILATGSDDRTIILWDLKTGQIIHTIVGHSWSVVALAFTPDGENLVSGSWDQTVKIWRVRTGEEIGTLLGHSDSVNTVAISPREPRIASGSKDKTIKLWNLIL